VSASLVHALKDRFLGFVIGEEIANLLFQEELLQDYS
jgi:hypothetical protein